MLLCGCLNATEPYFEEVFPSRTLSPNRGTSVGLWWASNCCACTFTQGIKITLQHSHGEGGSSPGRMHPYLPTWLKWEILHPFSSLRSVPVLLNFSFGAITSPLAKCARCICTGFCSSKWVWECWDKLLKRRWGPILLSFKTLILEVPHICQKPSNRIKSLLIQLEAHFSLILYNSLHLH